MKILKFIPFLAALLLFYSLFSITEKNNENLYSGLSYDAPLNKKEMYEWKNMRLRDPKTGKIPNNIFQLSHKFAQTLPGAFSNKMDKKDYIQSNEWQMRGPINIGGRTRALALDILDENIILAGGVSGGMWRSTDFGKTWNRTTIPNQLQSTSCIAQDIRPGKENIWYVGTGEYFNIYGGLRGDGIYKSTDGGNSWFILESTDSNTPHSWDNEFDYVWNIVTDHTNLEQDVVYAATAVGSIQKSTNGGDTWKTVLGGFGNTFSWFTDIAISPSGILYATLSQKTFSATAPSEVKGIYRSEDGENWINITPDFIPDKYRRIVLSISPSDENQVYFLAETPGSGKMTTNTRGDSLWHSLWKYTYLSGDGTDEGGIWEDRTLGIPAPKRVRSQFNSQGSYDLVIKVKPDNPDVVFIGGTNLYRSIDGFKTEENVTHIGGYCWDDTSCYEIYTYTNHHADEHSIIFLPSNPNVMLTGSDGGIAVTNDNLAPRVEWTSLNRGYFTTQFYTCAIDHAVPGNPNIIGGMQDNGTKFTYSDDINVDWTNPAGADGFHCAIADSSTAVFTSNNTSKQPFIKVWRTILDNKGDIVIKTRIDPIGAKDLIWNTPFKLDPNNSRRMYLAGGNIVWRNNNLDSIPFEDRKDSTSIGWDSLSHTALNNFDESMGRAERVSAIEISTVPENIVYYGSTYGRVFRIDNADIGDPEPVEITSDLFPDYANVGCIAVDPANANKVFIVFTNFNVISVFYSEDSGESWEAVAGNLEQYPSGAGVGPAVYYLEVLPVNGNNMYFVGTSTGLYSTAYLDGENTVWQQEGSETIGNVMVYQMDSRRSDGYMTVASFGIGMFSSYITSLPPLPQAPMLSSPINDTSGILDDITLEWEIVPEAGSYILEIASDLEFNEIVLNKDIKDNQYNYVNLEQGLKKYYWRVFAHGAGGVSYSSDVWNFETAISPPKLSIPENNSKELANPINFEWNTVENAEAYHLIISTNLIFSTLDVDTIITTNSITLDNFQSKQKYYWKVSSIHDGQEGMFSDNFRFIMKEIIGVYEKTQITQNFEIYPVPAFDKVWINIVLNESSPLTLEIFNLNGQLIQNKSLGYFLQGENNISFDLNTIKTGIYFINLKTRKTIYSRKIVIQ